MAEIDIDMIEEIIKREQGLLEDSKSDRSSQNSQKKRKR